VQITIWVLIAFLGTDVWPGALYEHRIPAEYINKEACEKGRKALMLVNKVYAEDMKSKSLDDSYRITYSKCLPIHLKLERNEKNKIWVPRDSLTLKQITVMQEY
jgi:hypothetical protein